MRDFLEAAAENEDYSIENYGTYDVDVILDTIGVSEEEYESKYLSTYKNRAETNTRGSQSSNNSLRDSFNSKYSIRHENEDVNKRFSVRQRDQDYENGSVREQSSVANFLQSERDPDYQKVSRVLQQENTKLREDVAALRKLVKLQRQVTGGTKFTKTSVEAEGNYIQFPEESAEQKNSSTGLVDSSSTAGTADNGITPKNSIRNPKPEVKKKFSIREPLERTKNLVESSGLVYIDPDKREPRAGCRALGSNCPRMQPLSVYWQHNIS